MVKITLRKFLAFIFVAVCAAYANFAQAQDVAGLSMWPTDYVRILWNDQFKPVNLRLDANTIGNACSAIADALKPGQGPWGLGIFSHFGCFTNGKLVAGQEGLSAWILMIDEGDRVTDFTLLVDPAAAGFSGQTQGQIGEVGRLRLPSSPWLAEFTHDREFAQLMALALMSKLPANLVLEDSALVVSGGFIRVKGQGLGGLKPPSSLDLFATRQGSQWQLVPQGPAKLEKSEEGRVWHFSDSATPLPGNGNLLLAKPSGPGSPEYPVVVAALSKRYKWLLTQRNRDFKAGQSLRDALQRRFTSSAYVGMRLGRSLVSRRDDLLVGAKTLGILGEFRNGPIKGFRLYYDTVPRVSKNIRDQEFYYESSHLIAGYGFIFEPPMLLDRIDLAPKVGGWRLTSRLPLINELGGMEILNFRAANSFSFGVEARGEIIRYGWIATGWVAQDITVGLLTRRLGQSASSQRVGFDLFAPGLQIGHERDHMNLSFLGFWYREDTHMNLEEPANFIVRTIASYLGAGASIAW